MSVDPTAEENEWMNAPMGQPGPDDDLPRLHRVVYGADPKAHIQVGAVPYFLCGIWAFAPAKIHPNNPDLALCRECAQRIRGPLDGSEGEK